MADDGFLTDQWTADTPISSARRVQPRASGTAAAADGFGKALDGAGSRAFCHVLLVEDERTIRDMVAETLLEAGFRVTEAESGASALELLAGTGGFDLLLTDIHMPGGVSGVELASQWRGRWPDMPVVYVTGRPDTLPPASALHPLDRLVVKPCRSSALLRAVRASLAA